MTDQIALPRKLMLCVALLQGLLLFALYKAFDLDTWPSQEPTWSFPLWTLSAVVPTLFLLSAGEGNTRRLLGLLAGFAALLALLALYTGWQAEPFDKFPIGHLTAAFAFSMAIACFKALIYLQQLSSPHAMSYQVLFTYSWRNFLVLALSCAFVLVFWAILALWASLFEVIGIDLFARLFERDWFLFPVLSVANGLGIVIFRELTHVIDGVTRLLQGLIKLLLPLVLAVALIFLAALPFTGLAALWATGSGTALIIALTAIILFFTNAVYQDGRGAAPYPDAVHRLVYIGLAALPLLCGLSFHGLWLRVDQYGWTVERSWAMVAWTLLTLFSVGYLWGVVTRRDAWPRALAQVNVIMGWLVVATLLLANSPLLDFRKLSLASQLARVDSGAITLDDFDFYYVHHLLARPGYLEMERIKADAGQDDPQLLAKIDNPQPISLQALNPEQADLFWQKLIYRPGKFAVPPELRVIMERMQVQQPSNSSVILQVDLNDDGQNEYVVLPLGRHFFAGQYYRLEDGIWQQGSIQSVDYDVQRDDVVETLTKGKIEIVDPAFKNLKIGNIELKPN